MKHTYQSDFNQGWEYPARTKGQKGVIFHMEKIEGRHTMGQT